MQPNDLYKWQGKRGSLKIPVYAQPYTRGAKPIDHENHNDVILTYVAGKWAFFTLTNGTTKKMAAHNAANNFQPYDTTNQTTNQGDTNMTNTAPNYAASFDQPLKSKYDLDYAAELLGVLAGQPITAENRAQARAYLHALGIVSADTGSLSYSELQQAIVGNFGFRASVDDRLELKTRWHSATNKRFAQPATPATPAPTAQPAAAVDIETVLGTIRDVLTQAQQPAALDHGAIKALMDSALSPVLERLHTLETSKPQIVAVSVNGAEPRTVTGATHKQFQKVLKALTAVHNNVYLYGAAGAGKTMLAEQMAEALNLPFHASQQLYYSHELLGFIDAAGKYHETEFYKAYKNGGIFLFDELDRSAAEVQTALNMALENGRMVFPVGIVPRHPDCFILGAGNTPMLGASRTYTAAQQADAALRDRFIFIEFEYDSAIESMLAGGHTQWLERVLRIRDSVKKSALDGFLVTPRATRYGAKAIAAGFTEQEAEDMAIWKGLDPADKSRVKNSM